MAYEIFSEADAKNLELLDKLLGRIESSAEGAAKSVDTLKKSVKSADGDVTLGGRSVADVELANVAGGRSRYRGPAQHIFPWTSGPNQRLDRAERALLNAQQSGDARMIADAQYAVKGAQKAVDRMSGTGAGNPIMEALLTSRIGPGGRLMPLVNRLKAAGMTSAEDLEEHFGLSGAQAAKMAPMIASAARTALPIVLGGGITAAVAGASVLAANAASERIGEARTMRWALGTTSNETSSLLALGGPESAGRAMAFGDRLRGGGIGAAYFRSRGLADLGDYTYDKGSNYLKAIDMLRSIRSDREATMIARSAGMDQELQYRDLSDNTFKSLKTSMAGSGDKGPMRDQAEYEADKRILGNMWNRFVAKVGGGAMKGLLNTFDPDYWLGNPLSGDWWKRHVLPGAGEGSSKATDTPRDYLGQNMGRQIGDSPEWNNAGSRARAALPPGYRLNYLNMQMDAAAANLGAFSVI